MVTKEPAYWALTYPKLTPNIVSKICEDLKQQKKRMKNREPNATIFEDLLHKYVKDEELLTSRSFLDPSTESVNKLNETVEEQPAVAVVARPLAKIKRKSLLPTFESTSKKLMRLDKSCMEISSLDDELTSSRLLQNEMSEPLNSDQTNHNSVEQKENKKIFDPFCHYNTALNSVVTQKGITMEMRLTGGFREELILSPYSGVYLKPYIRRDVESCPDWVRLMTEIQVKSNLKNKDYVLPMRAALDFVYVQPELIPAINSLCNQFFWPGIDLTDCLQYPEYSCVVLYKRLVVAFAFAVPSVSPTENYMSFIFTRPGWRNVGIGKFMIYHLAMVGLGKDLTLHVSMNNSALLLYQKLGFKIEAVVKNFYDKYIRCDTGQSKHAFYCRLMR